MISLVMMGCVVPVNLEETCLWMISFLISAIFLEGTSLLKVSLAAAVVVEAEIVDEAAPVEAAAQDEATPVEPEPQSDEALTGDPAPPYPHGYGFPDVGGTTADPVKSTPEEIPNRGPTLPTFGGGSGGAPPEVDPATGEVIPADLPREPKPGALFPGEDGE